MTNNDNTTCGHTHTAHPTQPITLNVLESNIIKWARERGIFDQPDPIAQHDKTIEEVLELRDAIVKDGCLIDLGEGAYKRQPVLTEIKDGIGDTIVTLTLLANMYGLNLTDCVQHAYDEIKNRTGNMVNGQFVKD